ncbi:MAG: tail fiber protein [Aliivibrio sp.]|uniref:phage tail protein n=1 Tax=Aliivibrio sp. TaxID=1872443 RepID=UPI001A5E2F0C|nr:tail fiber protein [Aliivibrio sp.]
MKNKLVPLLLTLALSLLPLKYTYASSEPFIGEVSMFAGNFAPRNFAFCEGQIISISQHNALFSLLGTIYGGDGRTTFALPNLKEKEKSMKGVRYIIALQGIYPSRN